MKTFKKPLCFQRRLIMRLFFHPLFDTAVMFLASRGRHRGTRRRKMNDMKHTSAGSEKISPDRKWPILVLVNATPWPASVPANTELWHPGLPMEYPGNDTLTSLLILNRCQPELQTRFISSPVFSGDAALHSHG